MYHFAKMRKQYVLSTSSRVNNGNSPFNLAKLHWNTQRHHVQVHIEAHSARSGNLYTVR